MSPEFLSSSINEAHM